MIKTIEETYEWLDKVNFTDPIPSNSPWLMVLLSKDFHRRLKDLEESEYERKHSSED
jgi:hypothetical protein